MSDHSHKFFKFKDIEKLSIITQGVKENITDEEYRFLKYYIKNPGISIYRICSDKSFLQGKYPKKYATQVVKQLLEFNLIESIETKPKQQGYYCKLSTAGIFFLLSNDDSNNRLQLPITWDLLKKLLDNYNDNMLFQLLLYPYIEYETLQRIEDSAVFELLLSYLRDCCKRINSTVFTINNTSYQKNGYIIHQLFIWENIPKQDYDTQSLRDFLKRKFQWNWINKATIKKTQSNAIEISYKLIHALIIMNEKQTNAELVVGGESLYEFTARDLIDETAIYSDELLIEGLRPFKIGVSEINIQVFLEFQQIRLLQFISSLFSVYGLKSPAVDVLSRDEKFLQSLKKMKKHFDKAYEFFIQ